jgi:RNA polymerase sigma-70 factor, ECF subfamily
MQSALSFPSTPTQNALPATAISDQALVQHAHGGDSDAVAELYQRHARAIYRYFYFRVKDHHIAEDLTGELFLQVVEALPRYIDRGRPFTAWLFRIARYRVIDYYRRTRVARTEPLSPALPDHAHEGSEAAALRHLEAQLLHSQVGELTEDQKTVVQLRFFEDYSLEDTAAIMGKSPAAVKGLQHRALQQLARRWPKAT